MLVIQTVHFFAFKTRFTPFIMGFFPISFGDNGVVNTVVEHIIRLLHNVAVPLTRYLFIFAPAIGQLTAVYGVVENAFYKRS